MTDPFSSATVALQTLADLINENRRLRQCVEQQERVIYTLQHVHERPAPIARWTGGETFADRAIAPGRVRKLQVQRVMAEEELSQRLDGAADLKEQAMDTLMRAVQAHVHYEMLPDSRTRCYIGSASILLASMGKP